MLADKRFVFKGNDFVKQIYNGTTKIVDFPDQSVVFADDMINDGVTFSKITPQNYWQIQRTSTSTGTSSCRTKYLCDGVYGNLSSGGSGLVATIKFINALTGAEVLVWQQTNISSNALYINGVKVLENKPTLNNLHIYFDAATKEWVFDNKHSQDTVVRRYKVTNTVPTYLVISSSRVANFGWADFNTIEENFANQNKDYAQINF